MATTQYIGARYVPKIYDNPDDNTNNWKQGIEYEPLTMVSYAGGSYISKVYVPASAPNPADAPQYWAYMGSSSGQITTNTNNISRIQHALANATEAGHVCTTARAEGDYVWIDGILYECSAPVAVNDAYVEGINITPVTDVIKALTSVINSVSDDVNGHTQDITNINTTIRSMQDDINAIEDDLEDPYTIMIGDSYGQGYDPAGSNAGWAAYLQQLGVTGISSCVGGAAFGLSESDPKSPWSLLSGVTVPADKTVKRIIVAMGYNDFKQTPGTVTTNIRSFVTRASNLYPEAKIYIAMIGYAWTHNENNINGTEITNTARAYAAGCENNKAIFMTQPLGVLLGCNGLSASDYKHPNETGNRNIASAIWAGLHGTDYVSNHYYSVALSNSLGGSGSLLTDVSVTNGVVTHRSRLENVGINADTAQTLTTLTFDSDHAPIIPGFCFLGSRLMNNLDTASGLSKSYYNVSAYWTLGMNAGMNLQLTLQMVNDAGNNFASTKKFKLNDTTNYQSIGSFF